MRNVYLMVVIILIANGTMAQKKIDNDSVQATIVLIGDAGQLINGRSYVVNGVRKPSL